MGYHQAIGTKHRVDEAGLPGVHPGLLANTARQQRFRNTQHVKHKTCPNALCNTIRLTPHKYVKANPEDSYVDPVNTECQYLKTALSM